MSLFTGLYLLQVCFSVFFSLSRNLSGLSSLSCFPLSFWRLNLSIYDFFYCSLARLTPTQFISTLFQFTTSVTGFALIHVLLQSHFLFTPFHTPNSLNISQFNLTSAPYNSNSNYLNKLSNKSNIPQQPQHLTFLVNIPKQPHRNQPNPNSFFKKKALTA